MFMKLSMFTAVAGLLLSSPLMAGNTVTFSGKDGILSVPRLEVDGVTYYDARLALDFASGTFNLLGVSKSPPTMEIALGRTFGLKNMQIATLPGTDINIRFLGAVDDSRCPIDAICIRAGSVTVGLEALIGYFNGDMAHGGEFSLTLGEDPAAAARDFSGYRLSLLGVTPAPRSDTSWRAEDYEIILRLDAIPAK
jgi:hypothetical protein